MSERLQADWLSRTDSGALYGEPGLELLKVQTRLCRAVIAVQGAQLLEFQAQGREPLLWLSPRAQFREGKPVRGGIPLCMPWFGVNRRDPAKPKHGLVRNAPWQLSGARALPDGEVELVFTYDHAGNVLFSTPFFCEVTMALGRGLRLQLALQNRGAERTEFSWAWHTYFPVEELCKVEVRGLEGCEYLDNTRDLQRFTQEGALTFSGEVDRIYEQAPERQQILTRAPIEARSENCHSVICWNPGAEMAETLEDVGEHYREYVCVEHGNAFSHNWQLEPGAMARASLHLQR
ncbi:D-hexose-6-phosphate mutarotase [Microbulbifer thermotolerans]|uniref:D-hexose-6-phosphate mutarotase n=1 Tax=Microbulbifer thermotolerans TaxID=252514 RepID=UPI00224ADD7A|nr:D-hexose-6-phosphate mutarotase [Microbulbifer thermotolerans]MCX2779223.1 D-hexose-6-phosphate mutarotase [Microbulbifer thermotolerans]MCX2803647.1 D-hexose-6-phosphate mutarotase [Microbulbifer thermotolerans]MCX2835373.1 D-hexose-6-phosphate mutarotase [Microbulbifer thermotolerans]WKT61409.1 D-hexose-6-phosphate mutarotase [Microbulbifer thermotolerans]